MTSLTGTIQFDLDHFGGVVVGRNRNLTRDFQGDLNLLKLRTHQ